MDKSEIDRKINSLVRARDHAYYTENKPWVADEIQKQINRLLDQKRTASA